MPMMVVHIGHTMGFARPVLSAVEGLNPSYKDSMEVLFVSFVVV
jgi:hypothetical protein